MPAPIHDPIVPRMQEIPPIECLRDRTDPSELLALWADDPAMCRLVHDLAAKMAPGDDLRFFDCGAHTGLAIVRGGQIIEADWYMHALIRFDLIIRWRTGRPSNAELLAVRKLVREFQNQPISEVKARLEQAPQLRIDSLYPSEADELEQACRAAGLLVERV